MVEYYHYSLERRFALSWKAHTERLIDLKRKLGNQIMGIEYESLLVKTDLELERIQEFIGLKAPFPAPKLKLDSLDKWRRELTDHQKNEIKSIVGDMWGVLI